MALRVSRLFVHPVKSCAGIEVERARLLAGGLELDRQWMIVDRSGRFVTQRSQPRLALLRPRTSDGQLTLSAPDGSQLVEPLQGGDRGPRVDVRIWWRTVPAHDCGDGAAAWLGRALGGPCRLVRRPAQRADSFADAAPILLLGQESLDALNRRLRASGAAEAGIERFRPNLVIAGADAFDEDHWHTVESTQWALGVTERCERCEVPNIDPATASIGHEPGDTLAAFRADPAAGGAVVFGVNARTMRGEGEFVAVGDVVEATVRFD